MTKKPKLIKRPLEDIWIIRALLGLVIVLALTAGYYQSALEVEKRKYARIEDLYVRVRSELGRKETQRLIDISREKGILEPEQ